MPSVSASQHRLMEAAAHTPGGYGGVPEKVGKEFVAADAAPIACAGILLRASGPLFLLVQNADDGQWVQPGGHVEAGETLAEAAVRECQEEVGQVPEGDRWLLRRSQSGGVDFTCYIQDVEPFEPTLDAESTNFRWCAPDDLPAGTHPEVVRSIELASGNELAIAKAIRANELSSPQKYENIWLFDVRITGTGTSYRSALDEYVYRPPENFLTDEYVERCNGLPLIFEHPKEKPLLDKHEYRDRAIGVVILPYVETDEVRGIAKVWDTDAAQLMLTSHISTSPAVVFRDAGSTETIQFEDGKTVLIEGKPSYLDHLAICEEGVWDKGGTPNGVNIQEDSTVDNEEKVPAWADGLNAKLDGLCSRMDAMEKKGDVEVKDARKDGVEEMPADARKDAESEKEKDKVEEKDHKEEKKEERKDSEKEAEKDGKKEEKDEKEAVKEGEKEERAERADAQSRENAELKQQIAAMNSRLSALTKPRSNADRDELSRVQRRAESVAMAFGDSNAISPALYDESPIAYRKRCAAAFQKHSPEAKGINLKGLDDETFAMVEKTIYADAQIAANAPAVLPKGRLMASVDTTTGHRITTYRGDPETCWGPFKHRGFNGRINKDVGKRAN